MTQHRATELVEKRVKEINEELDQLENEAESLEKYIAESQVYPTYHLSRLRLIKGEIGSLVGERAILKF